ncbi:MAG: glucokinase [Gammaproteobacteria bacterium]|nr:MAG: glucokinase [Gammaproteobacteria bacterium]
MNDEIEAGPVGLVADIGGTNARFALTPLAGAPALWRPLSLRCADFPGPVEAVRHYLREIAWEGPAPVAAVWAVAGPVGGERLCMTNNPWSFALAEVAAALGLERLELINDFGAVCWAVPGLGDDETLAVGGGRPQPGAPVAVVGPGTGLGVAAFLPTGQGITVLESEGGHAGFAPSDEVETALWARLRARHGRVSWERLVSGPGLEALYAGLAERAGRSPAPRSAAEVSAAALEGTDPDCVAALERFCGLLGSLAGDLALIYGARGGVYIAGGIVPRFPAFFRDSAFRARFEDKGRFRDYVAAIPTRLILAEEPGLRGAAACLRARHTVPS